MPVLMSFQHRLIINTHHASAYDLILNVLDRYGSDASYVVIQSGSVDVKSCTFSDYTDVEDEYESALASGPMLLMEGKVCSFPQDAIYTQRMARSVIGITAQGKMMLLTLLS